MCDVSTPSLDVCCRSSHTREITKRRKKVKTVGSGLDLLKYSWTDEDIKDEVVSRLDMHDLFEVKALKYLRTDNVRHSIRANFESFKSDYPQAYRKALRKALFVIERKNTSFDESTQYLKYLQTHRLKVPTSCSTFASLHSFGVRFANASKNVFTLKTADNLKFTSFLKWKVDNTVNIMWVGHGVHYNCLSTPVLSEHVYLLKVLTEVGVSDLHVANIVYMYYFIARRVSILG